METTELLSERGSTHGDFAENAEVSQALKNIVRNSSQWLEMTPQQQEAVEVVLAKISRIVTGNPYFLDHYRDIIGYTQLAFDATAKLRKAVDVINTKVNVAPKSEPQVPWPYQKNEFFGNSIGAEK